VDDGERALQFSQADFTGFFDVLEFGTASTQFAARFESVFALGDIRAAFEPDRFALE